VGLVIIGDELLKGKIVDANTPHAIAVLRKKGLDVRRVALARDSLEKSLPSCACRCSRSTW
jgi:molybdopterin-biosynthesis enzyme MoeA-like protein